VLPSMQHPHRLLPTMAHLGQILDTHALEQNAWWDDREVWETAPPSEEGHPGCLPTQGCSMERRAVRAGGGPVWQHARLDKRAISYYSDWLAG
jgi:hypothetical protein